MTDLLNVQGVCKRFGGNHVLQGVTFRVAPGEIVGLLGPNGSGKSTLLDIISGFTPSDTGHIRFQNKDMTRLSAHQIVRHGVARTFQLPSMPSRMSALEVALAADTRAHGVWVTLWRRRKHTDRAARAQAQTLLDTLLLTKVQHLAASTLSGGQKKLLSIACALMAQPQLLMLDEPTAGVHPNLRRDMAQNLKRLQAQGITQIIVEHDMGFVREVCTRCVVLDRGNIVANCAPEDLSSHPEVVAAYLGETHRKTVSA